MFQNEERVWYISNWFLLLLVVLSITSPIFSIGLFILLYVRYKYDVDKMENLDKVIRSEYKKEFDEISNQTREASDQLKLIKENILTNEEKLIKLEKQEITQRKKVTDLKIGLKAIKGSIEYYRDYGEYKKVEDSILEIIQPTVEIPIHSMEVKDLRSIIIKVNKDIEDVLDRYLKRYTTKANKTAYQLMVMAMQSELQNILYNLKFEKIDVAKQQVKDVTEKYLKVTGAGNKAIFNTMMKFIGEIETLYTILVETEYQYYVKRELAKEEQRRIREQMRQEAEERKLLDQQKKKLEQEDSKYHLEIDKVNDLISNETDEEKILQLEQKIRDIQSKLIDVENKKEEIVNLQNGKAGNVYVISNIGSFGENVFKVGMTRRLNPEDRIKELGSASVPFEFDVHSMIFSEDAPSLENKLHKILHPNRVNKINLRKEFFKVSLEEIEALVEEVDPAAGFRKTILASEFRATQQVEEESLSF
jgi:hypothetical protein